MAKINPEACLKKASNNIKQSANKITSGPEKTIIAAKQNKTILRQKKRENANAHLIRYNVYAKLLMKKSYLSNNHIEIYSQFKEIEKILKKNKITLLEDKKTGKIEMKSKPILKDPFETTNRKIFFFNDRFEKRIAEPIVKSYKKAVPQKARKSVSNFLSNASAPMTFFNSLLQGDIKNAMTTFSHLLINTTIGIGGIFDIAGEKGIKYNKKTFSQTLGEYGVPTGPYIVVPFIGPSSTRDLIGFTIDKSIDPTSLNSFGAGGHSGSVIGSYYFITSFLISGVDRREIVLNSIEKIRTTSFDPYSLIKAIYSHNRDENLEKSEKHKKIKKLPTLKIQPVPITQPTKTRPQNTNKNLNFFLPNLAK